MVKTKNALEIIDQMIGDDDELHQMIEEETIHAQIAQMIYDARIAANLTQQELADLIGTLPAIIAQLEDADCEGESLAMLHRIASVLNQRVEIRLVPEKNLQLTQ